jgi:hypothetical protein
VKEFLISFFIICLFSLCLQAQVNDTNTAVAILDTTATTVKQQNQYKILLDSNIFINVKGTPEALNIVPKKQPHSQLLFYFIVFLLLILGIVKTFFSRYFNTLFRVFFNTSLRQNQLTDQLEQAKLPSLIFNIFFAITTGLYIYLLVQYFSKEPRIINWLLLITCITAVAICYLVKYASLRFTGWVTNHKDEADTYIFIIFLLNKVIGILLLPIIILLAFSTEQVASFAVLFSFITLAIILLIRFFRSFSLLQHKLKVSRFHFLMYILALEIIPLLLIYKSVMYFIGKNP